MYLFLFALSNKHREFYWNISEEESLWRKFTRLPKISNLRYHQLYHRCNHLHRKFPKMFFGVWFHQSRIRQAQTYKTHERFQLESIESHAFRASWIRNHINGSIVFSIIQVRQILTLAKIHDHHLGKSIYLQRILLLESYSITYKLCDIIHHMMHLNRTFHPSD